MLTHNLGFPRMGAQRQLKKACEQYWSGKIFIQELLQKAKNLRRDHWRIQQEAGIDWIPCNDFSLYDHVLDMALTVGAIPARYHTFIEKKQPNETDLLFAMARGYQDEQYDITAMEMTKWFDTNYHYIVPEFTANQSFSLFSEKVIREFAEAKREGVHTKPVLTGPVTFLLLGKEKEKGFHRLDLLNNLLPVYIKIIEKLEEQNVRIIQFDEPVLSMNLTDKERAAIIKTYNAIRKAFPKLTILLASYFECYGENLSTVLDLPIDILHLDLVRCPSQLEDILSTGINKRKLKLSLGVVDGRNIWKNDFAQTLELITKAKNKLGADRILLAPSCSLLHVPFDLELEKNEQSLPAEIKNWMAFAKQKLHELVILSDLSKDNPGEKSLEELLQNKEAVANRKISQLVHRHEIKERAVSVASENASRQNDFKKRKKEQQKVLDLPLCPTTTIGSFPQTKEVRSWRAEWKKGEITYEQYDQLIKQEIQKAIKWQEEIGIDVLVHGEYERNDMVEYFGEQLDGVAFTEHGWVQSYGSRCVKPPVIFGDIKRKYPMTVYYSQYAQSLTSRLVKGMLTGPVTILQWSFVRNDQPRSATCFQLALAIRDEVIDLEKAGIKVIQVDEPAIREGLPLRKENWKTYLDWAVKAFRIATTGVKDATQIHTHMCYSEFNDIIENITAMDADVITIECSRSQMELLDAFAAFEYPNDIGPGVYDIHSPRIPSVEEMKELLYKAIEIIPVENLWVNPDCGLKTRKWEETKPALENMISAAREIRKLIKEKATS